MRRLLIILFLLGCFLSAGAQDFKVVSFSLLESDLTARVDPVFDLNGDACALIKVIGDKRFEISGPLGIVSRVDRTAETLLYVPAGTKLLTISHPRWGMLRNYPLPMTLEGKNTYELILEPLIVREYVTELMPDTLIEAPVIDSVAMAPPSMEIQVKVKKSYPSHWIFMAQGGVGKVLSSGVMVAHLYKYGFYASFLSNWASVKSDGLECNKNGTLFSTNTTPYYISTSRQTFYAVDAGATLLLSRNMYLYGGAGYGTRQKYWETIEGTVVKNKDLSTEGIVLSVGFIFTYKHLSAQIGFKSIALKDFMLTAGIGFSL